MPLTAGTAPPSARPAARPARGPDRRPAGRRLRVCRRRAARRRGRSPSRRRPRTRPAARRPPRRGRAGQPRRPAGRPVPGHRPVRRRRWAACSPPRTRCCAAGCAPSDTRAALGLAGAALLGVVLVPFVKYPPNPPAVGDPATRSTSAPVSYLAIVVIGLVAVWAGVVASRAPRARRAGVAAGRRRRGRVRGPWCDRLLLLPNIDEVPATFPRQPALARSGSPRSAPRSCCGPCSGLGVRGPADARAGDPARSAGAPTAGERTAAGRRRHHPGAAPGGVRRRRRPRRGRPATPPCALRPSVARPSRLGVRAVPRRRADRGRRSAATRPIVPALADADYGDWTGRRTRRAGRPAALADRSAVRAAGRRVAGRGPRPRRGLARRAGRPGAGRGRPHRPWYEPCWHTPSACPAPGSGRSRSRRWRCSG